MTEITPPIDWKARAEAAEAALAKPVDLAKFERLLIQYENALVQNCEEARAALIAHVTALHHQRVFAVTQQQAAEKIAREHVAAYGELEEKLEAAEAAREDWRDLWRQQHDRAEAAEARCRTLEEALREVEDTLKLVERVPTVDPDYGHEVRSLGERIGFSALMSSASASWAKVVPGGQFVAGPCHGTVLAALWRIRAALSASPQPAAVRDTGEEIKKSLIEGEAERIYNTWKDQEGWVPWTPRGNSDRQYDARREASAALEAALATMPRMMGGKE